MKNKSFKILVSSFIFMLMFTNSVFAQSFDDVKSKDWFYNDVNELSEKGIINGYLDETFKPNNNVTNIEALKMIMQTADLYKTSGENWKEDYIEKGLELNIIDKNFVADESITRVEMAELLVKALDEEPVLNLSNYFVDTGNKYVEKLYQKGFISGVLKNGKYYFYPNNNITRAEISAILNRTFKETIIKQPFLTSEYAIVQTPKTVNEFIDAYIYMVYNNIDEYTFLYDASEVDKDTLIEISNTAFGYAYCSYPELFSGLNSAGYEMEYTSKYIKYKVIIKSEISDVNEAFQKNQILLKEAKQAVEKLVAEGKITENMTQKEMAFEIYKFVCLNVEYDKDDNDYFTGYSAIHNGKAVCQGYTSLFNLMCRYVGIYNIQGVAGFGDTEGGNHMWTAVILDNKPTFVDTTWGDSGGDKFKEEWFDVSNEKLKEKHIWDDKDIFIW